MEKKTCNFRNVVIDTDWGGVYQLVVLFLFAFDLSFIYNFVSNFGSTCESGKDGKMSIFISLCFHLFYFLSFLAFDWESGSGKCLSLSQWMILFTFERLPVSATPVHGDVIGFHILSRALHNQHHIYDEKILSIDPNW